MIGWMDESLDEWMDEFVRARRRNQLTRGELPMFWFERGRGDLGTETKFATDTQTFTEDYAHTHKLNPYIHKFIYSYTNTNSDLNSCKYNRHSSLSNNRLSLLRTSKPMYNLHLYMLYLYLYYVHSPRLKF